MNPQKMICEICKSTNVVAVLDLGKHPLCDDLLKVGSSEQCEEFDIEVSLCLDCQTAHQMHPVPKRRLFPTSYHYRSAMTQDVLNGMQGLVKKIKEQYGDLAGKIVLDVGCNDGSLLKYFRAEGAKVYGVEPTAAASDARANGIQVINDYFDTISARKLFEEIGFPDFITFTNVFAHIENMDELLASVAILMGPNTRLIVENHYLGAVIERYQFDTFYHEHPRTYSFTSFVHIAKKLTRTIELCEFPARYGGNIRVVIGPTAGDQKNFDQLISIEKEFPLKFRNIRNIIEQWKASRTELLNSARCSDGKIYAKAFPGRAAILVKLLNLTPNDIEAVFEKPNSQKIGHYLPGTRIPILSDMDLMEKIPKPRKMLNLAWHISDEIKGYLKELDPAVECVDIFSCEKFKTNGS
jgi:SAM-dependent methyltransferase